MMYPLPQFWYQFGVIIATAILQPLPFLAQPQID
jgi:hypothetical protein